MKNYDFDWQINEFMVYCRSIIISNDCKKFHRCVIEKKRLPWYDEDDQNSQKRRSAKCTLKQKP